MVEEVLDDSPAHPVHHCLDFGYQRHPIGMRLPSLDAVRSRDLHALLHRSVRKLLRQSLHRKGQFGFHPRGVHDVNSVVKMKA